jgi:hypothetical protein
MKISAKNLKLKFYLLYLSSNQPNKRTFSMHSVIISKKGIIQNILSLNYDEYTVGGEYINNVISKNTRENYQISFDMKTILGGLEIFTFQDFNSIGFQDVDEIDKAFSIADSERRGSNNMGYGIFSPLTINKKYHSLCLFLQKKNTQSLYAIVLFISGEDDCLKTETGEYENSRLHGVDVSDLEINSGTQCIWVSGSAVGYTEEQEAKKSIEIINYVKKSYNRSQTSAAKSRLIKDEANEDTLHDQFLNLGMKYHDHLKTKKISFNGTSIVGKDSLGYGLEKSRKVHFQVEALIIEHHTKYRMSSDEGESWYRFNQNGKGAEWSSNRTTRSNAAQSCEVSIHCLPRPQDDDSTTRKLMRSDRKIYVKLDGIIIFEEEYSMHGYDELRVVLELNNLQDNQIDRFISPNANKSNSKLNSDFKQRIESLIKMTTKKEYFGKFLKPSNTRLNKNDRKLVWENTNGRAYDHKCYIDRCPKILCCMDTDWHMGHNIPRSEGGSNDIENLFPICAGCNNSMGTRTIDDYNGLQSDESD